MTGCKFKRAWIGPCDKPTVEGSDYCQDHHEAKCSNSGCTNQAIGECDAQIISLTCGSYYCGKCGRCHHCYPPEDLRPKVGDYCTKHGKKVVEVKFGRVPYCPECYIDKYAKDCESRKYVESYEKEYSGYQMDPNVSYIMSECGKRVHQLDKFCSHCGRLIIAKEEDD